MARPPPARDDPFAPGPVVEVDGCRGPRRTILGSAYSTRIATVGSTRSARRVGTTQATMHTPSMNAV